MNKIQVRFNLRHTPLHGCCGLTFKSFFHIPMSPLAYRFSCIPPYTPLAFHCHSSGQITCLLNMHNSHFSIVLCPSPTQPSYLKSCLPMKHCLFLYKIIPSFYMLWVLDFSLLHIIIYVYYLPL